MTSSSDVPHLPRPAPIEAYGKGGFAFDTMSHRGSLLCLPDGIWAWPVKSIDAITTETLAPVLERAGQIDILLLGAGRDPWLLPEALKTLLRAARVSADAMTTGAAVRTYNILLAEGRRVAAGLVAVD